MTTFMRPIATLINSVLSTSNLPDAKRNASVNTTVGEQRQLTQAGRGFSSVEVITGDALASVALSISVRRTRLAVGSTGYRQTAQNQRLIRCPFLSLLLTVLHAIEKN